MLVSGEGCVSRAEILEAQILLPDYDEYYGPQTKKWQQTSKN